VITFEWVKKGVGMISRRGVLGWLASISAAVVGGCALPVAGPHDWDIASGQYDPKNLLYALVRLTPRTVDILAANNPQIAGEFPDRRGPETVRFGVGDVLGITIFESGPGGLFTAPQGGTATGNYVTLPNQAVDDRGNISVPYAGTLRVKGRTAIEVQQAIINALKDSALKPQVVVSLVDQRASSYTMLGEVRGAGRFAVSASGERLLDAIARAGGLSGQGNESWVMLERDGRRALAPFGAIVDVPANNIYVRAHDTIYIFREPQTFLAFGAVGTGGGAGAVTISTGSGSRGGQFPFDAWRITLSEALAKTNGINDSTANASSVFLYRGETRHVAELLGVDVSKFDGPVIPIIYNIDLRNPAGYFLASKFEMRNKDVIYVSNASSIESAKVMAFIRSVVDTATDPIGAATSAYALKAATSGTASTATIIGVGVGH
jgi:polysaccharide biosynthesis/export protein